MVRYKTLRDYLESVDHGDNEVLNSCRFRNSNEEGYYYVIGVSSGSLKVRYCSKRFRLLPSFILPKKTLCTLDTERHLDDRRCWF